MTHFRCSCMLILFLTLQSCNGSSNDRTGFGEGGEGDAQSNLTNWLTTKDWQGSMVDKQAGNATQTSSRIKLAFDDENRFRLDFADNESAYSEGTYIQFAESLLFQFEDSNVSSFGLTGTQRDMEYNRFGDTLRIFDEKLEFKLTTKNINGGGDLTIEGFTGDWVGTDLFDNSWTLTIKDDESFEATAGNRSNLSLRVSGSYELIELVDNETLALLTVEETNNPDTEGMKLKVNLLSEDIIQITVIDKNDNESQIFTSKRKN